MNPLIAAVISASIAGRKRKCPHCHTVQNAPSDISIQKFRCRHCGKDIPLRKP